MFDSSKATHGRISLGVDGLDEVLHGGLPINRLYLVQGDPGVGKTTLAMQFLLDGVRRSETVLYITLSETKEELTMVAHSHDWDISKIHLVEMASLDGDVRNETENTFFHPSEVELNKTIEILLNEVKRIRPTRIVFDSLSELRLLAETALRYRRQILQLKQFFSGQKITVLLLDDRSGGSNNLHLESIAHGVLDIYRSYPDYGIARRQIKVQKLRGSSFYEGSHDLILRKGGMAVFPRLVAGDHKAKRGTHTLKTGIAGLDQLLGGGVHYGTSTLLMGPSGSGKSTLILHLLEQGAKRGERGLLFIFDETMASVVNRASALKIDIKSHIDSGLIAIRQVDPAELSPGELTHHVRLAVEQENTAIVAIDSINGYMNAMPAEKFLNLQLHELFIYLAHKGVITLAVFTQQGILGTIPSTIDLTYLADSVILFRFFESNGTVCQAISILKKRSGNHERSIRELTITASGLKVGHPLTNMQGVLTGTPSFFREDERSTASQNVESHS